MARFSNRNSPFSIRGAQIFSLPSSIFQLLSSGVLPQCGIRVSHFDRSSEPFHSSSKVTAPYSPALAPAGAPLLPEANDEAEVEPLVRSSGVAVLSVFDEPSRFAVSVLDELLFDESVLAESVLDEPPFDEPPFDEPPFDEPPFDESAFDESAFDELLLDEPLPPFADPLSLLVVVSI